MYLEPKWPLILIGKGLVLGGLTFKNRGHLGSKYMMQGGGNSNCFYFYRYLGNDPIWRSYVSNGLKPPTSMYIYIFTYTYTYKCYLIVFWHRFTTGEMSREACNTHLDVTCHHPPVDTWLEVFNMEAIRCPSIFPKLMLGNPDSFQSHYVKSTVITRRMLWILKLVNSECWILGGVEVCQIL